MVQCGAPEADNPIGKASPMFAVNVTNVWAIRSGGRINEIMSSILRRPLSKEDESWNRN